MEDKTGKPSCCEGDKKKSGKAWFRDPLVLTLAVAAILLAGSFIFSPLVRFRDSFLDYLRMIGWPIALGFVLGGVIDYYIPKEYISKYLAKKSKRTIFFAAGLGFLMTACSHGILALSMEIHKKGASGPAVISFLLASPWANLPITFLLIGFFGIKGFLLIFSALAVAISTGLIFQILDSKGWIEKNKNSLNVDSDFSIRRDISTRWKAYRFTFSGLMHDVKGIAKGMLELGEMVLWWVLIGMILASLISAFVPAHVFHHFFGPTFWGLMATLAIAAIMEVCSEGTAPLAFEIYKQTGAFGNTFAFLMGGVVTDYTEIGLVWTNLGEKTALWMILITLPQVILLGLIFNALF